MTFSKTVTRTASMLVASVAVLVSASPAWAPPPLFCHSATLKADKISLAPDLIPSNVPTCDGDFVSGFQIVGGGAIEWYADAQHQDRCFDVDVTFLPEEVSAYDIEAVLEFFGDRELDIYGRVEKETCVR